MPHPIEITLKTPLTIDLEKLTEHFPKTRHVRAMGAMAIESIMDDTSEKHRYCLILDSKTKEGFTIIKSDYSLEELRQLFSNLPDDLYSTFEPSFAGTELESVVPKKAQNYSEKLTSLGLFKFNLANAIGKNLHLIWLGSSIQQDHISRIKEWKKANPTYALTIWVDTNYKSEVEEQLKDIPGSCINDTSSLGLSKNLLNWVQALLHPKKGISNYAAVSDIYRIFILHTLNGWYADMDIEPFNLSTVSINQSFQFHVHAQREGNQETKLSPSVIASKANSLLTQKALECLELLSTVFNTEQYNQMITSNIASTRMLATHLTTGFAIRAALGKISVNGLPLLQVRNDLDRTIPNLPLFDSITGDHQSFAEQSWILTKSENPDYRQALPGITLDEPYIKMMSGEPPPLIDNFIEKIIQLSEIFKDMDSISINESKTNQPKI